MEAVLFDLDGLLADTEIISLKVYQEIAYSQLSKEELEHGK